MIGFWVVNLVIPEAPQSLVVATPSGAWTFDKAYRYDESIKGLQNNQCAETYAVEHPVSMATNGSAACDQALNEMTRLLLGASYLSGPSVTVKRSLPYSDVFILQASSHWPRERALGSGCAVVTTQSEFATALEAFVAGWPGPGQNEKTLLLVHHWLDSVSCWSFEDMYLSATTLLQIIAATEEGLQGRRLSYFEGVTAAATRVGVPALGPDFKDMRNNLIHEGKLVGGRFAGTTLAIAPSSRRTS